MWASYLLFFSILWMSRHMGWPFGGACCLCLPLLWDANALEHKSNGLFYFLFLHLYVFIYIYIINSSKSINNRAILFWHHHFLSTVLIKGRRHCHYLDEVLIYFKNNIYIYIYKINNVDASIIIVWWLNKFGLGDVTSQAALEFLWREREEKETTTLEPITCNEFYKVLQLKSYIIETKRLCFCFF